MQENKKQIFWEICRFLLIGGFATIVDYLVFALCNYLIFKNIDTHVNTFLSTMFGFISGLIINWIFSAKFVYRYQEKTTKSQFIIYVIICLIGLGITELGMFLGSSLFGKVFILWDKIDVWKWSFKIFLTLCVLIINYLGRKFLVFK